MKFLTKVSMLTAALGILLGAGLSPASATGSTPDLVTEFDQQIAQLGLSSDIQQQVVGKFDDLSADDQRQTLATLESNPADLFTTGEAVSTTTIAPAGNGNVARAAMATYTVTSTNSFQNYMLGVSIGNWNQRYVYTTGNNRVLGDYTCDGWYSGFSGFVSVSPQSSKWIANGLGNCITKFYGSLVYKGSSISLNKEMGMTVNGPGIVRTWLNNI